MAASPGACLPLTRGAVLQGASRGAAAALRAQGRAGAPQGRAALIVHASKKVTKKAQVVLMQTMPNLGAEGALTSVRLGYFRNYLLPQGMAKLADEGILLEIKKKREAEEAVARKVLADAQALATALSTIGKFTVKAKVGEDKRIFGSVSAQDVVEAVEKQTTKVLEKRNITLPEIKTTGTYEVSVKLHPQVTATFSLLVAKL